MRLKFWSKSATLYVVIKGEKQEYEYVTNKVTRLSRDVEYFLEINHPRKLVRNNFGAKVISHVSGDDWGTAKIKEILLERKGEYCLVNYMQGNGVHPKPCIYVAEPKQVNFIKEEV